MNIKNVLTLYKKQYDFLNSNTNKRLIVVDVLENRIYDNFFELGFSLRYSGSMRKFRRNLFIPVGKNKDKVKDYFNGLSRTGQDNAIWFLHDKLRSYSSEWI